MSTKDQESLLSIASVLLRRGGWRWMAALIAIPSIIAAIVTTFGYIAGGAAFVSRLDYAANKVPTLDSAVWANRVNNDILFQAVNEERDSLRMDGYGLLRVEPFLQKR